MHLLVFSHVGLIAEVVKVAGVGLGVEFRDEGGTLLTEASPIDLGEVSVSVNLTDSAKT
jgi:hypothetical protein